MVFFVLANNLYVHFYIHLDIKTYSYENIQFKDSIKSITNNKALNLSRRDTTKYHFSYLIIVFITFSSFRMNTSCVICEFSSHISC